MQTHCPPPPPSDMVLTVDEDAMLAMVEEDKPENTQPWFMGVDNETEEPI